jgi:zinc/manganese transport system substrate-binding protein
MKHLYLSPNKSLAHRILWSAAVALAFWVNPAQAADKMRVTASFSILGDIVKVIGGDRIEVSTLVGPDEDAHMFEPKPSDAKTILGSKLLVINGLDFEPWVDKLAKSAGYKGATLLASKGVKARPADPHAWQNPLNVVLYAQNIAAQLSKLDPAGASVYEANATAYSVKLKTLDAWTADQIGSIPKNKRKVITSHDAFAYFAAHYGLVFLSAQGLNTDSEPSAKQFAQLIQQIKREKIRAVFVENMSNPTLIAQLSKDAGATLGARLYSDALSRADQPGATYLQMMRHNVDQLMVGMNLN